jgi:ABC-type glycerol-3-phosphate transport system substrate-binding protein
VPQPAWTWDDFTNYAVKLTQREGSDTKVWGAAMAVANGFGAMNFFGGPLWSHGGDWADRENGVVTFQKPGWQPVDGGLAEGGDAPAAGRGHGEKRGSGGAGRAGRMRHME